VLSGLAGAGVCGKIDRRRGGAAEPLSACCNSPDLPEHEMANPSNPLRRSRDDRMIAGVCGGIAKWLDWDPTLVRILYVVASIFSVAFPGILVYLILWFVMPKE